MSKKRDLLSAGARTALTLAIGAAGALTATAAMAQDTTEDTEIVVTATRRDQALQEVPIAVTPVTAEMIQNSGIRDVQDLTSVAPSLQFNVSESEASATARLRGVGTQGSNPGLESAVGIFVDGVYRARNGVALTDLGEVQQIEVLRGPQGTLFGRNTSAGLITINTVQPDLNDFSVGGEATYGDFGETRVSAEVNVPLSEDVLGLRVFGAMSQRDGFMDMNTGGANPLLGSNNLSQHDSNTRDMYTLRAQLLAQFSPHVEGRFIVDYSERDEFCCAAQVYNPALLNGHPVTILSAAGVEGAPIAFGAGRQQLIANLGGYGPTVNALNPLGALGAGNIDDRHGFANRDYAQSIEDYGGSAEFNWEMDSGVTLTSITAYRNWFISGRSDSDYSQADLVYVPGGGGTEFQTLTQEVRIAGEWGNLDWLLGAFYSNERINRTFSFFTGSQYGDYFAALDNVLVGGTQTPGIGNLPGAGASAVINNLYDEIDAFLPAGAGTGGYTDRYHQEGSSIALFSHNIFSLGEHTDLTVGVRFTHETKSLNASFHTIFDGEAMLDAAVTDAEVDASLPAGTLAAYSNCNTAVNPASAGLAQIIAVARSGYCVPWFRDDLDAIGYNQERSEDEWSGVVALRHEFSDNISAYASVSRGYKGGGFNLDRNFSRIFTGGAPNTSFAAEFVDAYEAGLKTGWFDNHLLLNLAVYHNEYENFQLNTFNGIQFVVTSVPEVQVDGAELDMIWRTPIDGLSIQGGVAYNDATYGPDCTPAATCGGWVSQNRNPITGEPTLARLPNSQLTNSPEITATTAFTYERPLFNGALNGLFYLDARYVGDQNTGSDLRPSKEQPAYTLINGRIGISSPSERWALEIWGRNLTDEGYGQIMFDVPLQLGSAGPTQGAFLGDPRTYGVTLRVHY